VAKALDDLFRALQAEEEGRPTSLHANGDVPCDGGSSERAVIAPTALREALSAAGGQGFEIGASRTVLVSVLKAQFRSIIGVGISAATALLENRVDVILSAVRSVHSHLLQRCTCDNAGHACTPSVADKRGSAHVVAH